MMYMEDLILQNRETNETNKSYKSCFVIAHKYNRNYMSFIKFYVNNIQTHYENALILIVDNNSKYFQDIRERLGHYRNIVFLTNDSECKFELGAYKTGIEYLVNMGIISNYDFFIFTQDTFILKRKYDFNQLFENKTTACAINSWINGKYDEYYHYPICQQVLKSLHLENSIDKLSLCWCCSFVLHTSKVLDFFDTVKEIVITTKHESQQSERFLSAILYRLNNDRIHDIDGCIHNMAYNCWTIDLFTEETNFHFVKRIQQKTENTPDL